MPSGGRTAEEVGKEFSRMQARYQREAGKKGTLA
jgi:hypothetical protein